MSFATLSPPGAPQGAALTRPTFNSQITSDRLRVGSGLYTPPFKTGRNIRKGRQSVFKEMGLNDEFSSGSYESPHAFVKQLPGAEPNTNAQDGDNHGRLSESPTPHEQHEREPVAHVAHIAPMAPLHGSPHTNLPR